jgi:hypothetical protein
MRYTMTAMDRSKSRAMEAMELTSFKLRGSIAEFVAANAAVDAWLAKQPGFRLRRIAQGPDGTVFDLLLWDTVAHGEQAAERLLAELPDSPVHAMIDHRTVQWRLLPVHHASGASAPTARRRAVTAGADDERPPNSVPVGATRPSPGRAVQPARGAGRVPRR